MKHILLPLIVAAALSMSSFSFADMTPEQARLIHHANPMPNLMMVVNKNKDQLDLSEEQASALKEWHSKNQPNMMQMAKQVMTLEKKLSDEALAGASGSVLQQITSEIFNVRGTIIKTKLACRNNMHDVLNEEQWNKVVELYKKSQEQAAGS